jgi:hypothetical protein
MDTFIATNFKVKKAQADFNPSFDVFKTPVGQYLVYDYSDRTTKLANDTDFEQNFFQLAFTYIKDKIPTLIDFMVGFEVVDKNDDGTQSLGLFMFEVRGRKFYVPVMYSNGELKGADLLYDHSADRFVPNKDNWVDHILSQSPAEAGFAAKEDESDLDIANPDITELFDNNPYKSSNVPLIGAVGLNNLVENDGDIEVVEDESTDDDDETPQADAQTDKSHIKDASTFDRMLRTGDSPKWGSLTDFFRNEDGSFASKFAQTLMREPELHKAAHKFYGNEIYEALAGAKFAQDAAELPKVAAEEAKLKVVTSPIESGVKDILNSEEEIQSLVENGIAFVDNRGEDEKAIPYRVETDMAISSPTESGKYSVLMRGGVFEDMYIFANLVGTSTDPRHSDLGSLDFGSVDDIKRSYLAIPANGKEGFVVNPQDILVQITETPGAYVDYIDSLSGTDKVKNSKAPDYTKDERDTNLYIFIDPDTYRATVPLYIENKVTVDNVSNMDAHNYGVNSRIERVSISDKYRGLSLQSGTLCVSSDCKVIEVIQPEHPRTPALGGQIDLDIMLRKDFEDIKVSCVGPDEYHVLTKKSTVAFCMYKKALTTLVVDLGLTAPEARQLLVDAKKDGKKIAAYS